MAFSDVTEGFTDFNPSSIGGWFDGILPKLAFWFWLLFYLVVFIFGVIAIYKFWFQFNIKITLMKRIGVDSVEVNTDKAKIVVDDQNKTKLCLLKQKRGRKFKVTCPIPEAKYKGKSGRSDHYILWLDDNYELHPIEPPHSNVDFSSVKIRPQERAAWGRMEDDIIYKKYQKKDKLLQYAAPALILFAGIIVFLIFFFGFKSLDKGFTQLATAIGQMASSCTKLTG